MREFDHRKIEAKWQELWDAKQDSVPHKTGGGKKSYLLVEFPYPSGAGLHTGHVRSYTAMDVVARKRRGEGQEVLYPIGWDAFGLPTENYALKTGKDPREVTRENTDTFRRQLKMLGISFDWDREINTTDPAYYKWTQWIFLQLFKKGLAYKAKTTINWCPKCKIGLANEEVVDNACERCGQGPVEKREKEQWMLAITKYAQRLYDDLDTVDYIERAKVQQRNWIGPSEGALLQFKIQLSKIKHDEAAPVQQIEVFTTRADTLYGATYLVLAPEHPLIPQLKRGVENEAVVDAYVTDARTKSEIERGAEGREKTGVELRGVRAINPASGEEIPVWVADYVLGSYGTGAIMAVPAHDERDFAFAQKYGLPIRRVVAGPDEAPEMPYPREGVLIDSGPYSGSMSTEARIAIAKSTGGTITTTYKLRDWVFSRQRYWGEPIPLVYCPECKKRAGDKTSPSKNQNAGWVPVPEEQLPVVLPKVEKYEPTSSGESPLANITEWVETVCPVCGGPARRETDVMPNWAGSSWYYLRYVDPHNDTALADPTKLREWTPVSWYNGGMEHTTLHLLYSRFWHKFLYDIGVVPTPEPYAKRTSHGLILAEDGEKMSKSKGNVVSPDDIVAQFGADALRVYEMFMGPFDQPISWSRDGLVGARRFLERVHALYTRVSPDTAGTHANHEEAVLTMHRTVKKVTEDIEALKMNTAVSQLMVYLNTLEKLEHVSTPLYEGLLRLLAPFAPHLTEELWAELGHHTSIHGAPWPVFDTSLVAGAPVTVAVQVNGRTRGTFSTAPESSEESLVAAAQALPNVAVHLEGREVARTIVVPAKLVNFVTTTSKT